LRESTSEKTRNLRIFDWDIGVLEYRLGAKRTARRGVLYEKLVAAAQAADPNDRQMKDALGIE
jgi:hypothetical protein